MLHHIHRQREVEALGIRGIGSDRRIPKLGVLVSDLFREPATIRHLLILHVHGKNLCPRKELAHQVRVLSEAGTGVQNSADGMSAFTGNAFQFGADMPLSQKQHAESQVEHTAQEYVAFDQAAEFYFQRIVINGVGNGLRDS